MIDYEKLKTRRGLWKKTEQPGYVKKKCQVEGCQTKRYNKGYCAKHYQRVKTHGDHTIVKNRSHAVYDSLEDFLLKNSKKETAGCWVWTAGKGRRGYGSAGSSPWGRRFKTSPAHRLSYICYKGEIPKGLFVCHTCDNPPCINPEHLFLGTHRDNMKDMYKKQRDNHPGGESSHKAKLTKEEAIYILKNMETISAWELSTKFNVSRQTIQNIWHGITKYIEPELREEIMKEEFHPKFEGEVKELNHSEDKLEMVTQESCQEELKKAICCGKEWIYTKNNWSVAKCHLCGKPFEQESCQHESDGYNCDFERALKDLIKNDYEPVKVRFKCIKCGEFY